MGIINHFSQGNNDQEYEGLHSHWKDEKTGVERLIEGNSLASELHREASNKAYYNLAIDKAIEVVTNLNKEMFPEIPTGFLIKQELEKLKKV
jgi:hypothetical protein